jgi:hypothetical protein
MKTGFWRTGSGSIYGFLWIGRLKLELALGRHSKLAIGLHKPRTV